MDLLDLVHTEVDELLDKNIRYDESFDKEGARERHINGLNNVDLVRLIGAALDKELSK